MRRIVAIVAIAIIALAAYLLLWPVPIDPVAWQAPKAPELNGPYAVNDRLGGVEFIAIAGGRGPEDLARDRKGNIYTSLEDGRILRIGADGRATEFANTGGRPLGLEFTPDGTLIVADAYKGLLSIDDGGRITVLSTEAEGIPIAYADDVDIASDGRIFFTDATTKFPPARFGGTYPASLLDIMEHGSHGRLLRYDPQTRKTTVLLTGLNFANGVAVSPDQRFVLVNETGSYRVTRYWLAGEKAGSSDVLIDNLPGFPDNIAAGRNGRFWIGLASPRNPVLDSLADKPFLRRVVQRLPAFLRPQATAYGHVLAVDGNGRVVIDLQDPQGRYPVTTGALETDEWLYISSLHADSLARIAREKTGLK